MRCHSWRSDRLGRRLYMSFSEARAARPSRRVRRRVMAGIRQEPGRGRQAPGYCSERWLAPPVIRLAVVDELIWGRGRLATWWLAL